MRVVECSAHLHATGGHISYSRHGTHLSLTFVSGTVGQHERHGRHLANGGLDASRSARHVEELFFGHREISIHLREVRHHRERLLRGRSDQCADTVGDGTDHPRTGGTNRAERELIVGVGECRLGLFELAAECLQLILGHFQVILRNDFFLSQRALIVDGELLRSDGRLRRFYSCPRLIHRSLVLCGVDNKQNLPCFDEISFVYKLADDVTRHFGADFHVLHTADGGRISGAQVSSTRFDGFNGKLIVVCSHHLLFITRARGER